MGDDTPAALGALRVDEGKLKDHVDEVVRSSVEETLNALLDAEADQICLPNATSDPRSAWTAEPATTSASSKRRPVR